MAAPTGTPPGGTTGTSNGKPRATKVIDSTRDRTDSAAAATTETNQPSAEKILETSPPKTGGPTPSAVTVTQSDTGKSSSATYSGSTGIGGVTEPGTGTAAPTTADTGQKTESVTDTLTETAKEYGQQVGSRAAAEWEERKRQVSEAAGQLRESASRTAEQVRDAANRTATQVRRQSRQGVDAAQDMVSSHPLATAMVALGVGLLIGGLIYGQTRRSQSYRDYDRDYDRDQDLDLGEYGSSRTYRTRDRESEYRRAEGNADYNRSGY